MEPSVAAPGRGAGGRWPPEALFVVGGLAQYTGASIAVGLFDDVRPATVAWLRVIGGALALLVVAGRPARGRWDRHSIALAVLFGAATALMNLFIYLAFARIDLGKAVAIEFIGPIVVAAVATRGLRNTGALGLAVIGVVVLSQVDFDGVGTLYVLAASAMWAGYIVAGWRVARLDRGLEGLAVGLAAGSFVILPFAAPGLPDLGATPALIPVCLFVGVLSTAVAYGLDQAIMRRASARRFAVMQALLPVIAACLGVLVLEQFPRPVEYVGIAMILTAVALQTRDA